MLWPQWPNFDTCKWQTDVKIEISASNHRRGHQNSKNDIYDVIEGHWRWMTSVYLGKVTISLYQCKRWISLRDVHIRDDMHNILSMCISPAKKKRKKKTPSRSQVTGVETLRNANFADMTLKAGHRSNKAQRSWQVQSWDFQGRWKFSKISYTLFRYDQSNRPRVIFGKPEEGLHQSPYQPVYPSSQWHIFI